MFLAKITSIGNMQYEKAFPRTEGPTLVNRNQARGK